MKATSEWFPAAERGLAGGFFNMGASLGSMLAAPLVAWAILTHSWQFAFVLTGVIGLVWAGLWLTFYQSPSKHRALSARERDYILSGQETHLAGSGRPSMRTILAQRNFWGIAIPRFLADPTWGTLTFWLPLYLTTVRGFDLTQIAMFAWLPFLAADLGCMFGGTISMTLQNYAGMGLINARRCAFTAGALMMIGVAFVGMVDNPYVAVGAAESRRVRASDTLGHRHHDGLGPVQAQRGRHRRRHGRHVRQRRRADLLAADGCARRTDRLHAVLRRPRRARCAWRRDSLDRRARAAARTGLLRRVGAAARMDASRSRHHNPILRGFNPDPSIVRVGDDYYIATSTFEWFPGVQIHHSRDLVHWRLVARPLTRASQLDMRGDPDSCGVWAPCLTHADGCFI